MQARRHPDSVMDAARLSPVYQAGGGLEAGAALCTPITHLPDGLVRSAFKPHQNAAESGKGRAERRAA